MQHHNLNSSWLEKGVEGCRIKCQGLFFNLDDDQHKFHLHYLPVFNQYIEIFTSLQGTPKTPNLADQFRDGLESSAQVQDIPVSRLWQHAINVYLKKNIKVPSKPRKLKLEAIRIPVGSLAVWSWYLPHRNAKNTGKNKKPRIVGYLQFNPVNGVHGSRWESVEHREMLFQNSIGTVVNGSSKAENRIEKEAIQYYDSHPYSQIFTLDGRYQHVRDNGLLSVLLGFHPITFENVTWKDFRNEKKKTK